MTMAWVLIILVSQSSGPAATTAYFADEISCRAALAWAVAHKSPYGVAALNAAECFKTSQN